MVFILFSINVVCNLTNGFCCCCVVLFLFFPELVEIEFQDSYVLERTGIDLFYEQGDLHKMECF